MLMKLKKLAMICKTLVMDMDILCINYTKLKSQQTILINDNFFFKFKNNIFKHINNNNNNIYNIRKINYSSRNNFFIC